MLGTILLQLATVLLWSCDMLFTLKESHFNKNLQILHKKLPPIKS